MLSSFTDLRVLLPLILGAVLAIAFIFLARRRGLESERFIFSLGLVVAALIYLAFALAGAGAQWIMIEAGGLALFGGIAFVGLRRARLLLAMGWTAHVAWDVGLHLVTTRPFVPTWYPIACIGFDLLVAGYILAHVRAAASAPASGEPA